MDAIHKAQKGNVCKNGIQSFDVKTNIDETLLKLKLKLEDVNWENGGTCWRVMCVGNRYTVKNLRPVLRSRCGCIQDLNGLIYISQQDPSSVAVSVVLNCSDGNTLMVQEYVDSSKDVNHDKGSNFQQKLWGMGITMEVYYNKYGVPRIVDTENYDSPRKMKTSRVMASKSFHRFAKGEFRYLEK